MTEFLVEMHQGFQGEKNESVVKAIECHLES